MVQVSMDRQHRTVRRSDRLRI